MPMTLAQIEHEVDQLPQSDFEKLAEYIFEHRTLSEHDRIWGEEAQKRLKAYKEGRSKAYPANKVIKDLKAELAARHK